MPKQGAWCLHIALELKSEFVDKFLLKFAELARHVEANEPDTLSYEIGRSDQHANKFIIVERYAKKEHLADPHQTSEPFKKFKEWMNAKQEMFVSKEGLVFTNSRLGICIDRPPSICKSLSLPGASFCSLALGRRPVDDEHICFFFFFFFSWLPPPSFESL